MTTNLEEMKKINRLAIMQEMVEKTKNCGLIWDQISPTHFRSKYQNYEFSVSKTNQSTFAFDVLKDKKLFRTYNSSTQDGIDTLYEEIESCSRDNPLEKYKTLTKFLSSVPACYNLTNIIPITIGSYGVKTGGNVTANKYVLQTINLSPNLLSFSPTTFAWTGNLSGILTNNGDTSYIRQQVSGEFPTNWGYAFVEFDNTVFANLLPPYQFQIQLVHRREANDGVVLNVDLLLNSAVAFNNTIIPIESYNSYNSGFLNFSQTSINQAMLRLSMFTNTGNLSPRALRITYVNLTVKGFGLVN